MDKIKIESVFEESTCTTCGRFGVDQYSSILDNYIKYKNKLISFVEIIKHTLNFEPTADTCSMEICDICKVKLQEFYNFKQRSSDARKIQSEFSSIEAMEKLQELDSRVEDPLVYSTLQIVREFIKSNSIKEINYIENPKQLVIFSQSSENVVDMQFYEECESEFLETTSLIEDQDAEYLEEEFFEENSNLDEKYQEVMECDDVSNATIMNNEKEDLLESDSQTEDSTSNKTPKNPRRMRLPDQWASNKRKKLRNSGQTYLNSKGRVVEGRKMMPPCENCRSRCDARITEEDRQRNFNNFWELGDIVKQRKFIYEHITSREPARRKSKSAQSNRSVTLQFYLDFRDSNGTIGVVQVCKKMFKNTLAVSCQVIQGVVTKYSKSGFIDPRGKHVRKMTEAQELAREHVQRFPFFYIDQSMTKVQLYQMYVDECKEKGLDPVKESNYREIFDKFNSNSFLKSEKILCVKCHEYYKSTDEEKKILQKQHDEHISIDKKCRDRALGRIRYKRLLERKKAEKTSTKDSIREEEI